MQQQYIHERGPRRSKSPNGAAYFTNTRIMVLRSTRPLIETSTGILPGDKERAVRKSDNLNAICEQTV
jgi:hypothetical protein